MQREKAAGTALCSREKVDTMYLKIAQGGNLEGLKTAQNTKTITSSKSGYISKIDALAIGKLAKEIKE